MKKVIKCLKKQLYKDAFELLEKEQYQYSLESLVKDFSDIDHMNLYCFLTYVLSIKENSSFHLLICDFLIFQGTFFYDIYPVIRWHLNIALKQDNNNLNTLNWIIEMFYEHPGSPYSDSELAAFAKDILRYEPNNERAQVILKNV